MFFGSTKIKLTDVQNLVHILPFVCILHQHLPVQFICPTVYGSAVNVPPQIGLVPRHPEPVDVAQWPGKIHYFTALDGIVVGAPESKEGPLGSQHLGMLPHFHLK